MGQVPSTGKKPENAKIVPKTQTPISQAPLTATSAKPVLPPANIYTDPISNAKHTFVPGDTVILVGQSAEVAKTSGYAPLGKIVSFNADGENANVQLFTVHEPSQEGGIGLPAVQRVVPMRTDMRPLPFEFNSIDQATLKNNAQIFTCQRIDTNNAAGCASCDPSGAIFDPQIYADRLNQVYNAITEVHGGPGATRYTLLSCPATIVRAGQPLSVSDASCRLVIIATITGSNNTNRYSLISSLDPVAFKAAYLYAYGLPVDDPSYYRAVMWSRIPEYKSVSDQLQGERISCVDVDAGWLDDHVRELLAKGYESRSITLLPGQSANAPIPTSLLTPQQQQSLLSLSKV